MKQLLIVVVIVLVGLNALIFGLRRVALKPAELDLKPSKVAYGVILHPNAQLLPVEKVIEAQMKAIKELGATFVKTDHITRTGETFLGSSYNDQIVKAAKEAGLNLVLVIDWQLEDIEPFKEADIESRAFEIAKKIAGRYLDKVRYYQISSEPGGLVLKSPFLPGLEKSDYDEERYQKIKLWLKGTLDGLEAGDPKAKAFIVGQFLHLGFFDRLKDDGIDNYHGIGWDLYSDVADNLETIRYQAGEFKLLEKLKSYDKELWLTEVAKRDGTTDGNERVVADYLERVFDFVEKTEAISGYFVYELTDQPAIKGAEANYGLIGLEKNHDGSFALGVKKEAYWKLKELFQTAKRK